MIRLVDEEEDLVLLHEDPLAVLGDVLEVKGHVHEDLVRVQRPVALGVKVTVEVMPTPVMVVEVQSWRVGDWVLEVDQSVGESLLGAKKSSNIPCCSFYIIIIMTS